MKRFFLVFALISWAVALSAQNITGQVVDAKTAEPLPFANVYLNNTTLGAVSNAIGVFNLKNVQPGSYELVVSFVGYESFKMQVSYAGDDMKLDVISLKPSDIELSTVEVKGTRDKSWERQLKRFEKVFFGNGHDASLCRILNPWVLDFPKDDVGGKLLAKASAPLEIMNEALGYKVFYDLTNFWAFGTSFSISGNIRFEELNPIDNHQKAAWSEARESTFQKSYNYFFKAILDHKIDDRKFIVYSDRQRSAYARKWVKDLSPNFERYDTTGVISKAANPGEYMIAMKGLVRIQFRPEKVPYLANPYVTSDIRFIRDYVRVNRAGFVLNPKDLIVSGEYSLNRIAALLPISYQPQENYESGRTSRLSFDLENVLGSVTGSILDSKTKNEISDVDVFIQGTSLHTTTNEQGYFTLENVPSGFSELVLYKKGYQLFKSSLQIRRSASRLTLTMNPQRKELRSFGGKNRNEYVKQFVRSLVGPDSVLTLQNMETISTHDNENEIKYTAREPLKIDNSRQGYHINYYLQDAVLRDGHFTIHGYWYFQTVMSTQDEERIQWEENRLTSYTGSLNHMLRSLLTSEFKENGFTCLDAHKKEIHPDSLVIDSSIPGHFRLTIKDSVMIVYRGKTESQDTTEIKIKGISDFNQLGVLLIPENLMVTGAMKNESLSHALPWNYIPQTLKRENFTRFFENIYVHTDKPYYYPGETIWFKGYVNYATPEWRDSLSHTVYVELIDRGSKSIIQSKTLEISKGFFHGDFRLTDSIKANTYYLRAYTNFNRNFGDQNLYVKPLPVLHLTDKVNSYQPIGEEQDDLITITTDKETYRLREKITLSIKLKDIEDKPVYANLSVSVLDAAQVAPLEFSGTILTDYPLEEIQESHIKKGLPFQMEYGINFSGQFLNENNTPEKAALNVFQLNPNSFTMAQSDEEGMFSISGLTFYDTASFLVQSAHGKEQGYGRAEFVKRKTAAIDFKESEYKVDLTNTETVQRILSDYEAPKGARMLQEIEIKSARITEEYKAGYREARPYGSPDYVIKKEDINSGYGNLLLALPGKIPGLIVRQAIANGQETRWVVYVDRSGGSSIKNAQEAIVTVNDVMVGGTPEEILSSIDPATVETIEVKTGISVLYGSMGGNGIVSVYTKKELSKIEDTEALTTMKVPGYARTRKFNAPDYGDQETDITKPDYRSTLSWNPNVVTDSKTGTATLSFFAADLPGKYRVVVEGVTENGEPVRAVYFVEVNGD